MTATTQLPPALEGITAIEGRDEDYDQFLDAIGNSRIVLLGEASHGTHEFYRERARITKRLIDEKQFTAVAVEADWPDAYRVNRYVMGMSDDASADEALSGFERFPAWMWRNQDMLNFAEWMRVRNDSQAFAGSKARFYGLDLYSMRASMHAVIDYLQSVDPEAARVAIERYSCFDHVGGEGQEYGYSVAFDHSVPCEPEVIAQLVDMRNKAAEVAPGDMLAEDEAFFAEQNARLVLNAERYYRAMYRGRAESWNLRDLHMYETLNAVLRHLEQMFGSSKVVVWEHNSHVGDARATDMGTGGQLNVGQLVRSGWSGDCYAAGFTTHRGWVTAASDWGAPMERKRVRAALPNSYEEFFSESAETGNFALQLKGPVLDVLPEVALERAIGVIYRPETERVSHWFHARLADQFDSIIHIDDSSAVEPLDRTQVWERGEPPETYPTGL